MNTQKDIYLTDLALNRILRIDSTGHLVREVGGFGWSNAQFDRPLDIWAENTLDVFVADYNNHRIQRFDRNLNFVSTLGNDTNLPARLQFGFPVSVAFSRFGDIFIVGQEHNRILQIDASANPTRSFGDYDWGDGSLEEPLHIAISGKDHIYVADVQRGAIVKFDYYGNYLQEIRHEALTGIGAIAIGEGALFVLNKKHQQFFAFHASGDFMVHFDISNELSTRDGAENEPDIAIAGKMLYILDGVAGEIHCYQIKNSNR